MLSRASAVSASSTAANPNFAARRASVASATAASAQSAGAVRIRTIGTLQPGISWLTRPSTSAMTRLVRLSRRSIIVIARLSANSRRRRSAVSPGGRGTAAASVRICTGDWGSVAARMRSRPGAFGTSGGFGAGASPRPASGPNSARIRPASSSGLITPATARTMCSGRYQRS